MPTPTKKPVDLVTVSLSDADFMRIVGDAMDEVINREYGGRIEVMSIARVRRPATDCWSVGCLLIPADD